MFWNVPHVNSMGITAYNMGSESMFWNILHIVLWKRSYIIAGSPTQQSMYTRPDQLTGSLAIRFPQLLIVVSVPGHKRY